MEGAGEAGPRRRRGGARGPAANRSGVLRRPRPARASCASGRSGGGAPLLEGSAAVGRCQRGSLSSRGTAHAWRSGRPPGSSRSNGAARGGRAGRGGLAAVARQEGLRERAWRSRLLKSAPRGNQRRFPVNGRSWPSCRGALCRMHVGAQNGKSGAGSPSKCRSRSSSAKLPSWTEEKQGTGVCVYGPLQTRQS